LRYDLHDHELGRLKFGRCLPVHRPVNYRGKKIAYNEERT